jgi:uncharacterized protein (DUF2236 family)
MRIQQEADRGEQPLDDAELERLIGPGSALHRHMSDWRVWIFIFRRAVVLQAGHPVIAAALEEHSRFQTDPYGRFTGTLQFGLDIMFGDDPLGSARRLREYHRHIKGVGFDGRPYHAWDRQAWAFVHLTAVEAALLGIRVFHAPVTADELEQVYAGWRAVGTLYGVAAEDMPAGVAGLGEWFDEAVDQVGDNPAVRRLRATVRRPPLPPGLPVPGRAWWLVQPVAGLLLSHVFDVLGGALPTEQRRRMHLPWTRLHRGEYVALIAALRAASVLPDRLLTFPAAHRPRLRAAA